MKSIVQLPIWEASTFHDEFLRVDIGALWTSGKVQREHRGNESVVQDSEANGQTKSRNVATFATKKRWRP